MIPQELNEIAAIRAEILTTFDSTCTILAYSESVGSGGGRKATYTEATTAIKCRISPDTSTELDISGKLTGKTTWIIKLPYNTTITTKDRIKLNNTTYEITGITHQTPIYYKTLNCTSL